MKLAPVLPIDEKDSRRRQVSKKVFANVKKPAKKVIYEILKEGAVVWLIQDNNRREYYKLGWATEISGGPYGVFRSAIVPTNNVLLKKPVLMLASLLQNGDVFAVEHKVDCKEATFNDNKTGSTSNRALKLEY